MSKAQVSNLDGIPYDVETNEQQAQVVRCVTCHTVYEHTHTAPQNEENTICPECGDAVWLGLRVPVAKTGAAAPA